VRPPWNGYIYSNEKGVFLCILSFVAQQKKVRVKKYDANGNMTAVYDTAKQFNRILYWDDDNRLTKTVDTTSGASVTTQYHYDAKGMRIIKDGPYGKSIYIDTGYVESGATQTTAPIVSNHIFVGNTRMASVVKHTEEKQPATYFYASDHLGSSSVLTTQQGSYHERIEYLPYGETWVEDKVTSDSYTTPYKFTGKELDTETGLYYFGARYYDARVSRWMSADPALQDYLPKTPTNEKIKEENKKLPGMGGVFNVNNLDVYHYSKENPIIYIDPDGRLVGVDDLFGWTMGRLFGLRNDSLFHGVAQNFKESWSLIGGMFNTFHGVNTLGGFVKGIGELGIRLTWNLPNEILGTIAGYGAVEFGGAVTEMWGNVQLVKLNNFNNSAFTLGSKIIGQDSFFDDIKNRKHEQGHYYQSLLLGPTYIGIVGIPSSIHYYYAKQKIDSGEMREEDYYKFYTEALADRWGGVKR